MRVPPCFDQVSDTAGGMEHLPSRHAVLMRVERDGRTVGARNGNLPCFVRSAESDDWPEHERSGRPCTVLRSQQKIRRSIL